MPDKQDDPARPPMTIRQGDRSVQVANEADIPRAIEELIDPRTGDCVACGRPVRQHFDAKNRKLPCHQARDRGRAA